MTGGRWRKWGDTPSIFDPASTKQFYGWYLSSNINIASCSSFSCSSTNQNQQDLFQNDSIDSEWFLQLNWRPDLTKPVEWDRSKRWSWEGSSVWLQFLANPCFISLQQIDKCPQTSLLTFLTIWEMTKLPNDPVLCNFLNQNFQFGPDHRSGECHQEPNR